MNRIAFTALAFLFVACEEEPTAIVPTDGPATVALTWDNFGEDFHADYCVSCHSTGGQATADFREYDVVTQPRMLNSIRCGVANTQLDNCEGEHPPMWFPIGDGPEPTREERRDLVVWADAGGPR